MHAKEGTFTARWQGQRSACTQVRIHAHACIPNIRHIKDNHMSAVENVHHTKDLLKAPDSKQPHRSQVHNRPYEALLETNYIPLHNPLQMYLKMCLCTFTDRLVKNYEMSGNPSRPWASGSYGRPSAGADGREQRRRWALTKVASAQPAHAVSLSLSLCLSVSRSRCHSDTHAHK